MELAQSGSQADHMSAARYPARQEVNNIPPQSAPSGSFLQNAQRPSYHANGTSRGDPSIAAPHTTYASYGQHSHHAPRPGMTHSYPHPDDGMYGQPRAGYVLYGGAPPTLGQPVNADNPVSTSPQSSLHKPLDRVKPLTVFHFDPSVQKKGRKRRSGVEIERMYNCGWNDCEKAYGTLNHLNAHVTMKSHGQKRTPDEFKKIREEWKQRKKEEEEEANRKHQGERQRQAATAPAAQNRGGEPWGPYGILDSSYTGSKVQTRPSGYQFVPQQHFIAQKSTYDRHQHSQSYEQLSQFRSSPYDLQRQGVTS